MWKAISKFCKLKCHKRNRHNCNEAFTIRFSINLHSWNCNICGKLFPNLIKSKCHKKYRHNCKKCGKVSKVFQNWNATRTLYLASRILLRRPMLRMSSRRQGRLVRDKALKLFENMKSFKRKHLQDGGNVCIAAVHVGRGAERPKQALCSLRLALNSESLQCMWTTISRFYQIEMPQKTSS